MALILTTALLNATNLLHNATMRCYHGSSDNFLDVTFDNITDLLGTQYLDTSLDTAIFAPGYLNKVDGNTTLTIINAYLLYTDKNVCQVNWETEANVGIDGINYPVVLENSQIVGKQVGIAIVKLIQGGMDLNKLILIGHSLGAHLFGATGRQMLEMGYVVVIIIGLDIAGPGFYFPLKLAIALSKKDAKKVYCIHTDPDHFGTEVADCSADIFVNYGSRQQPGCETINPLDACSHSRAVLVWSDSIVHPYQLECSKASNYFQWVANNGAKNDVIFLGEPLSNTTANGTYFMSTNAQVPYGKGDDGLKP